MPRKKIRWNARELAIITAIPKCVRANYKAIPELHHRSKQSIATKRYRLRERASHETSY